MVLLTVVPHPLWVFALLTKQDSAFHCAIHHFKKCYYSSCLPSTSIYQWGKKQAIRVGHRSHRGRACSNLIGCSELNGDCGHVNCGAWSFLGVYFLDKMRFCFPMGHPLFTPLPSHPPPAITQFSSHHFTSTQGINWVIGVGHLAIWLVSQS